MQAFQSFKSASSAGFSVLEIARIMLPTKSMVLASTTLMHSLMNMKVCKKGTLTFSMAL
jgi:hypothetical protein